MSADYPLTLFYDAACPVCALEMDNLRRRNVAGHLLFVDISASDFDARRHGFSASALDAAMHALRPDGSVLRGMAALRLAYQAVGLGWLLRPTGAVFLKPAFDAGYRVFARHRRPISRALAPFIGAVATLRARRAAARLSRCADAACQAGPARAQRSPAGRSTS